MCRAVVVYVPHLQPPGIHSCARVQADLHHQLRRSPLFKKLLFTAALTAATAATASATPISGSFSLTSFGGSYVGGTAATATGLDFGAAFGSTGNGYGTNGTALVGNTTGSFASLNGTTASIADISLAAFANPYTANPFISFNGSNIVLNFTNDPYTRSALGTTITIAGVATFTDGIAADTNTGTFSLATSSEDGTSSSPTFTFTSNASTTAVAATPEPTSLALLGTGLLGIVGVARKRLA